MKNSMVLPFPRVEFALTGLLVSLTLSVIALPSARAEAHALPPASSQSASHRPTTTSDQIIGYGSSDAVLSARDQEAFFSGFHLGLEHTLGSPRTKKMLAVEQVTGGSPVGAAKAYKELQKKDVRMLVGFPSSHEAVQVAKLAAADKILTLFIAAGHSSLAENGPCVFTTGESMKNYIEVTRQFLERRFKRSHGIFVYNPKSVFSANQKVEFEKSFASAGSNVTMEFVPMTSDLSLDRPIIDALKAGKYAYIFLSTYADESAATVNQLARFNVDAPIVTNSSWSTGDIEMVRRAISTRKSAIYAPVLWQPGSPASLPFEALYRKRYGASPNTEAAGGYDVGVIAGTVIKRAGEDLSRESVCRAFHRDRCFSGTSVGRICFPKAGGHSDRGVLYMQITKSGLVKMDRLGTKLDGHNVER